MPRLGKSRPLAPRGLLRYRKGMTSATAPFSFPATPVRVEFVSAEARALYADDLSPATSHSVGTDLRACFAEDVREILPGERLPVPSGLRVQPLLPGIAGFLYSRSGLGARDGLVVAQGVGVIDPDYTGEIIIMLLNTSTESRRIRRGERVAQLCIAPVWQAGFAAAEELSDTDRGIGGFGSTGK